MIQPTLAKIQITWNLLNSRAPLEWYIAGDQVNTTDLEFFAIFYAHASTWCPNSQA